MTDQYIQALYNEHYTSILVTDQYIQALYNEHYTSILVTFWGETEHFSGKNGALSWGILVGKQKHNVQKPSCARWF